MAICSPARAPISSISLSAGIKRPFDFIIFGSFTWKQEVDGENLSNLFSLGWSPLNPSGSGRTGPLGAETKISLKHVTVKSTWHSAWNFVRAREMSLSFSSQWSAALPQGISGAYPAIPPQIRPPGKSPTTRPSPQQSLSSVCSENLMKQRLMMLVHKGLCTFQIVGTILCPWDVIACLPRAHCETCLYLLTPSVEVGDVHCPISWVLRDADCISQLCLKTPPCSSHSAGANRALLPWKEVFYKYHYLG